MSQLDSNYHKNISDIFKKMLHESTSAQGKHFQKPMRFSLASQTVATRESSGSGQDTHSVELVLHWVPTNLACVEDGIPRRAALEVPRGQERTDGQRCCKAESPTSPAKAAEKSHFLERTLAREPM